MFDTIGIRMKNNYESITNTRLTRRTPVIIRIDGKAFHSFTKGFQKPFDTILVETMQETALKLCKNIENAVFAYTQSDEISILLIDYKTLNSQAWFDNKIEKITSVSASMATLYFNQIFNKKVEHYSDYLFEAWNVSDKELEYEKRLQNACKTGALFDSRCFNIPKEEVTNYFFWRQNDASRNSVQMVARANFSCNQLFGKSNNEIQNMLLTEKNINWNNLETHLKRGTAIYYDKEWNQWYIDKDMPILKNEGRNLIDQFVFTE